MTGSEFRRIAQKRWGNEWMSGVAKALDINPRTIRRWASDEVPIPDDIAIYMQELNRSAARDEWIIGTAYDNNAREYIIHAARPRFIARLIDTSDDDDMADMSGARGLWAELAPGEVITEFIWLDPPPVDKDEMLALIQRAASVWEIYNADTDVMLAEDDDGF